jgi:hypothetical protein
VGIDLASGRTKRGVWGSEVVSEHPDTEHSLSGLEIPGWSKLMEMAASCYELSGLGYVGVDFVLDREKGPLILELNARPGLAIQIANGNGILDNLRQVQNLERQDKCSKDPVERANYSRRAFPIRG